MTDPNAPSEGQLETRVNQPIQPVTPSLPSDVAKANTALRQPREQLSQAIDSRNTRNAPQVSPDHQPSLDAAPAAPQAGPANPEDLSGQEKGTFDKIGDGFMKGVALFEKLYKQFLKQFQNYGSAGLTSLAKAARFAGWEKAAKFLEDLATSDRAALKTARGSLKIEEPVLPPNKAKDPAAVEAYAKEMEAYDAKVEELGAYYSASQGYPNKVAYFRAVVQKFTADNSSKDHCTIEDLIAMAKIVPQVNPLAPKQTPTPAPVVPEAGMDVTASVLTINGAAVSRVEQNGEKLLSVGGKKFRMKIAGIAVTMTKTEQMPDQSLRISGTIGVLPGTVRVTPAELNRVVSQLSGTTAPVTLDVSYLDAAAVTKTKQLTFEVVS